MSNYALFIGWDRPIHGQEAKAAEIFDSSMKYYNNILEAGIIESFEPVILSLHGGDLNGFIIIRGDRTKLTALQEDNEFNTLIIRCDNVLSGFGVVPGYIGDSLQQQMGLWREIIINE